MALSVPNVVKATGSGVTSITTSGVTTTTGSTFTVGATGYQANTTNTPTDSKSNVYTAVGTTQSISGVNRLSVFKKENGTGGASHTCTVSYSGSTDSVIFFLEVAGAATASYDSTATAQSTDSDGTPHPVTSGTLAQASEAVISWIACDGGGTQTYSATGFTVTAETDGNTFWTGAVGYQIVSSTSAVTASWANTSTSGLMTIAAFKAAAGGSNSYTITPSGSVTFSGNAPQIRGNVIAPSGSIVFSGAATIVHGRAFTPGGSVVFSGSAVLRRGRAFTPSGSVVFSGSAPITNAASYTLNVGGSVTMSGTSLLAHGRIFLPAGTVAFSGTIPLIKGNVIVPTGQIVLSGNAPITYSGSSPTAPLRTLTITFVGT